MDFVNQPADFKRIQDDIDRQTWTGRASLIPLPGDGNEPKGPGASPAKKSEER